MSLISPCSGLTSEWHIWCRQVFPLLEGLTTLVTDVVPQLCVNELDVSLQVAVNHEDLVAAYGEGRAARRPLPSAP